MTTLKFFVNHQNYVCIHHNDLPIPAGTDLAPDQVAELFTLTGIKALSLADKPLIKLLDHTWTGATYEETPALTRPANPEKSTTLTKLRHDIVYILQAYSSIDWEYVLDESFISDTNSRDMPLRRVIDKEKFYSRDRYRNWTAMVRDWLQGLPSAMGGMVFATYEIDVWQAAMGVEVGDDAYWDGMARAVGRIAKGVRREV